MPNPLRIYSVIVIWVSLLGGSWLIIQPRIFDPIAYFFIPLLERLNLSFYESARIFFTSYLAISVLVVGGWIAFLFTNGFSIRRRSLRFHN